jgi:hypothetical protein
MRSKLLIALIVTIALAFLAGPAFAAKLLCISNKNLQGETTVGQCLARGDQFAVVGKDGVPQILSKEDIEVFKTLNPGAMNMKAYGIGHIKQAPEIPHIEDYYGG